MGQRIQRYSPSIFCGIVSASRSHPRMGGFMDDNCKKENNQAYRERNHSENNRRIPHYLLKRKHSSISEPRLHSLVLSHLLSLRSIRPGFSPSRTRRQTCPDLFIGTATLSLRSIRPGFSPSRTRRQTCPDLFIGTATLSLRYSYVTIKGDRPVCWSPCESKVIPPFREDSRT